MVCFASVLRSKRHLRVSRHEHGTAFTAYQIQPFVAGFVMCEVVGCRAWT